jgi:hypothetical protein
LQCFGKVCRTNRIGTCQIGNRSGQFEHPMIGSPRELELAHGRLHQALGGCIWLAEFADFGSAHIGICQAVRDAPETNALAFSCRNNPRPNGG